MILDDARTLADKLRSSEDYQTYREAKARAYAQSSTAALLDEFYTLRMMNLLLYIQFAFITLTTAITFFMLEKNNSGKVRGGEVIQMMTSGFSRKRVAMPFFIVGCIFIFFMCYTSYLFY